MKYWKLYLFIFSLPFLFVISINEWSRFQGYKSNSLKHTNQCTWACHNDTKYCKANHVKYAKPYFKNIDSIYFGIIQALQKSGNYVSANILWLVILLPLLMYILLIQSIRLQLAIRYLKKDNNG